MSLFKKGVRWEQDADRPMREEEVPPLVTCLTDTAMRCGASLFLRLAASWGWSVNQALAVMEDEKCKLLPLEETKEHK
jgi:hypothetical protein